MSNRYRKSTASAFFKDKGFNIVLTISIIMVIIAGYMALNWNTDIDDETADNPDNAQSDSLDVYEGETPDFGDTEDELVIVTDEGDSAEVLTPQDGITDSNPLNTETEGENGEEPSETPLTVVQSYIAPCSGEIVKNYSGFTPVFSETLRDWRIHTGIDFATSEPVNVSAVADGIVEDVYSDELMGVTVLIRHPDGMLSLYQSLAENPKVLNKMEVKQGDIIGKTGATASAEEHEGTHLHFELILNGANCDPNDYIDILKTVQNQDDNQIDDDIDETEAQEENDESEQNNATLIE